MVNAGHPHTCSRLPREAQDVTARDLKAQVLGQAGDIVSRHRLLQRLPQCWLSLNPHKKLLQLLERQRTPSSGSQAKSCRLEHSRQWPRAQRSPVKTGTLGPRMPSRPEWKPPSPWSSPRITRPARFGRNGRRAPSPFPLESSRRIR